MSALCFVSRTPHGHTARVSECFGDHDRLVRVAVCGESDRIDILTTRYGLSQALHITCAEARALAAELLLAADAGEAARAALINRTAKEQAA